MKEMKMNKNEKSLAQCYFVNEVLCRSWNRYDANDGHNMILSQHLKTAKDFPRWYA